MNARQSGGLNRKLLGGVVFVVGIVVVVAAVGNSNALLSFLPYLLILACPLMMLFMMGPMGHMGHNHGSASDGYQGGMSATVPDLRGLAHEEQVRALRGELTRMSWRQEALRHDLEQLEAEQWPEHEVDAERRIGSR